MQQGKEWETAQRERERERERERGREGQRERAEARWLVVKDLFELYTHGTRRLHFPKPTSQNQFMTLQKGKDEVIK